MPFANEDTKLNTPYTPSYFFIKDTSSSFLDLNLSAAQLMGWSTLDRAIYKTDYDMPCPTSEFADNIISMDRKVINTQKQLVMLEILNMSSGWTALLARKSPFFDNEGKIAGLCIQSLEIYHPTLLKQYECLSYNDNKIVNSVNKPAIYILNPEHSPLPLSPREQSCVFLLIRGKIAKEIAYILGISARTVEAHIESIKHKLGCNTKGQIIEKALDAGFLYYIPEEFLKK